MVEGGPSENSERNNDHNLHSPLFKALQNDDWKSVEDFIAEYPEVLTATVNVCHRDTFLHMICGSANTPFSLMKKLLERVTPELLEELKDYNGESVIFYAIRSGNENFVELLVSKNKKLAKQKNRYGCLPITIAAVGGNKEICAHLLSVMKTSLDNDDAIFVVFSLIRIGAFGEALDVLKYYSDIFRTSQNKGSVLHTLAEMPLAFESGSQMGYWEHLIYKVIPVQEEQSLFSRRVDEDIENPSDQRSQELLEEQRTPQELLEEQHTPLRENVDRDTENPPDQTSPNSKKLAYFPFLHKDFIDFGQLHQKFCIMLWKALMQLAPSIKRVHDAKLAHEQALKIVRMMCHEEIIWSSKEADESLAVPFLAAATWGISEIVHEILKAYFYSFQFVDINKRGVFVIAIEKRHHNILSLIKTKTFGQVYTANAHADNLERSSLLHSAAKNVPSSKISSPALQMQRELQWFEGMESYLHPSLRDRVDQSRRTPRQVFTEEHKQLQEKVKSG